jgi:hypothetical protein
MGHGAAVTDPPRVTALATLLWEEGFWVCLRTQRLFPPRHVVHSGHIRAIRLSIVVWWWPMTGLRHLMHVTLAVMTPSAVTGEEMCGRLRGSRW